MIFPNPPSLAVSVRTLLALGIAACMSVGTSLAQTASDIDWQPGQIYDPKAVLSTPHNDIRKLLRRERYDLALKLVDKQLTLNPRDPQMRFWRGFLYERMSQPELALPIYLDLSREYPELPEPHNNLGVLYAAQGKYDEAKAALDNALRANPNYAVAQENMGDVLVNMARLSYERALKINPKQPDVNTKLQRLQPVLDITQGKEP
jgi:tetratricopeptide (TPR) repeat protein